MKTITQLCLLIGTLVVQPIPSNDPNIIAYCVQYIPYATDGKVVLISRFSNQFPVITSWVCKLDKEEKK